jgi:hypothetical protein
MTAEKRGARHSNGDMAIGRNAKAKAKEIIDDFERLGFVDEEPEAPAAKGDDLPEQEDTPVIWGAIKAAGDWELDVLAIPYGGQKGGKDSHGEYFGPSTNLHEDKFTDPLVLYYHGYTPEGKPQGDPIIIGKVSAKRWTDQAGRWVRVLLDKGNQYAARVWAAAKAGKARASTGSIVHLVRKTADGLITNWPFAELSIFDTEGKRQPANQYAVALPVMKSLYQLAGKELPDLEPNDNESQPEAAAIGESAAKAESEGVGITHAHKSAKDITTMDEKEIVKLVADTVTSTLDARENAAKAEATRNAEIEAAKEEGRKAAKAEFEKEAAKGRRLPIGDGKAPYQSQFGDTRKYDNLNAADTDLLIEILTPMRANSERKDYSQAPETALKALALKLDESKSDHDQVAKNSMKAIFAERGVEDVASAMKANELNHSTQAGFGDEWVGVAYSTRLWEAVRQETFVAEKLMARAIEVPQGMESIYLPLEGADLTFYKVAQATANNATTGIPDATVTASKIATDRASLTLAKMGARGVFSGEMNEDSLIPFVPNLNRQLELGAAETLEHVAIDGDTATGATTNINDIGGTPAGTEAFLLLNGFRKSPLVTTTANSRSAGTLTVEDFLETLKLMGLAGRNAFNHKDRVEFILDAWTAWKALELTEVKTRDVFVAPTIENGELASIYGFKVNRSAFMHWANQDATYGLKANTSGKVDLDTASNNTTGSILAVRWDQWQFGIRRRMTIETTRIPQADATQIVALMRFGMTQRDTEASAISYAVTL